MIHLTQKASPVETPSGKLTLTFEQRSKSRLRWVLDDGREVAVVLERGAQLFPGDTLLSEDGETVRVEAANEMVSIIRCDQPLLLARACYHLGNRHVALQIAPAELRYLHDHVLDEMVTLLGLKVESKRASFEPESGAYGAHAHIHHH